MTPLTDRLVRAMAAPAVDDAFDPHAELAALLADLGMSPGDTGGEITFRGRDPVVAGRVRDPALSWVATPAEPSAHAAVEAGDSRAARSGGHGDVLTAAAAQSAQLGTRPTGGERDRRGAAEPQRVLGTTGSARGR